MRGFDGAESEPNFQIGVAENRQIDFVSQGVFFMIGDAIRQL